MGLPSILVVLAKNQSGIAAGLHEAGAAINLGWFGGFKVGELAEHLTQLIGSFSLRQRLSTAASALVDGYGTDRVVSALQARILGGD